ncbi:hypothetical protein [Stenotrophomonas sp. MMGLT7]|uniref:hypothetical protein n=1 Tax=Stenotrophomonas sp. MMGLT7 TaxID=2901227 RepID=UPI001E2DE3DA|nr:hypothetical protein [Stenotrophomonas sp. MMGLT7]MCD7099703.1 hypothetical protein [Stenotrophomonas sp. MMGLT7]
MKSHILFAIAISVFGLSVTSSPVSAQEQLSEQANEDVAVQIASAYIAQQKLIRKTAPIHSAEQLAGFLAKTKDTASPIDLLSPVAKARFVDSLRFNETGVTSFYYADIESELNSSQAYELLSTFGLQSTLAFMPKLRVDNAKDREIMTAFSDEVPLLMADHENYWCSSRATCSRDIGSICMSGC